MRACIVFIVLAMLSLAGCKEAPRAPPIPFEDTVGTSPKLPDATTEKFPGINLARARGWPAGKAPAAAPSLSVSAFARDLEHPRWLYVLPNGDVLVAETNGPPPKDRPDEFAGIRAKLMMYYMWRMGAGVESRDRITLWRETGGKVERHVLLEKLKSPFGMALIGNDLYVANTDAVMRYPYVEGATKIAAAGTEVIKLPAGPRNHHWTKNLLAATDGTKLYAAVGSNSDHGENGGGVELERAAIWEIDLKAGTKSLFGEGLRNPNGLAWEPKTGALWTVVNERDELGDNLVPDFLTSVTRGAFYGWPDVYLRDRKDTRVPPDAQRPTLAARAVMPDYSLGSHVAPLGLAFAADAKLGEPFTEGAFIGQHGSWNREPRVGYNVVFVPFRDGRPSGKPIEVLGGFVSPGGRAYGRPVGVAIDKRGDLLVADDVGNTIWRVSASRR